MQPHTQPADRAQCSCYHLESCQDAIGELGWFLSIPGFPRQCTDLVLQQQKAASRNNTARQDNAGTQWWTYEISHTGASPGGHSLHLNSHCSDRNAPASTLHSSKPECHLRKQGNRLSGGTKTCSLCSMAVISSLSSLGLISSPMTSKAASCT